MKKYYKHSIKNLLSVKSIMTIEYLELSPSYLHTSERHDFWELVYVDKGEISYAIEDNMINLHEGQIIFLSPNQKHAIFANGKRSPNIFVLCFQCQSPIMNIFSNYAAETESGIKALLKNIIEETKGTFKMPFRDFLDPLPNPNIGGEQAIKLNLELLLIQLLRHGMKMKTMPQTVLSDKNFDKEITELIISYLKAHLNTGISIDDICGELNYSKTYLSKIFKKTTGKSIITFFNELKIEESKRLVRETSHTMAEISDILGFSDPRYFNHLFKSLTKLTPTQYKKSIRKFN